MQTKMVKKKITPEAVKQMAFMGVAMGTMAAAMMSNVCFADGAQELFKTLIKILAKVMYAPAAFFAGTGAYSWASAHAEGDGPEMKKALGRLSAAVMIAVVATILLASAETLASLIETSL